MTRIEELHALLDEQIAEHRATHGGEDPSSLHLTHDEIDEWRTQFASAIPVASLAYKHIPIFEVT